MRESVFKVTDSPQKLLDRYVECGEFTKEDAEIIRKYLSQKVVLTGSLSDRSQIRIIRELIVMHRFLPVAEIKDLTTDMIYSKINNVYLSDYKQNTKRALILNNKPFWIWLSENNIGDLDSEKLLKIRSVPVNFDTTSPEEILTPDEILSMIAHAGSARNRAFITTLYESAGRISEIASLKWRDLVFDEDGIGLWINDFKTKNNRYVRLIDAKPHLLELKNDMARTGKDLRDEFVFQTNRNEPLSYIRFRKILQDTALYAGIKKRVHLHLIRKSRITHLSQDGYSEAIIKQIAWGNQNTNMMRVYNKLSHKDIDSETLRRHGLKPMEETETKKLHSIKCIRCGNVITPDQKFCSHCGLSKSAEFTNAEMSIDPEILAKALKIIMEKKEEL